MDESEHDKWSRPRRVLLITRNGIEVSLRNVRSFEAHEVQGLEGFEQFEFSIAALD